MNVSCQALKNIDGQFASAFQACGYKDIARKVINHLDNLEKTS